MKRAAILFWVMSIGFWGSPLAKAESIKDMLDPMIPVESVENVSEDTSTVPASDAAGVVKGDQPRTEKFSKGKGTGIEKSKEIAKEKSKKKDKEKNKEKIKEKKKKKAPGSKSKTSKSLSRTRAKKSAASPQ